MQDIKQQEEMNKRFEEQFVKKPVDWRENHGWTVPYVDSRADKLLDFLQSEINLALANRDKEIVEMIEDMFLCNYPIYDKNRNIKEIEKDIINLITKANKE